MFVILRLAARSQTQKPSGDRSIPLGTGRFFLRTGRFFLRTGRGNKGTVRALTDREALPVYNMRVTHNSATGTEGAGTEGGDPVAERNLVDEVPEVSAHERVVQLAESQHGVIGRHQLREAGLSTHQIQRLGRNGNWEWATSRVLRRTGTPRSRNQDVATAVFDAGPDAYLSHESAAALWGHRGSSLDRPFHVSTTKSALVKEPVARVHRIRKIPAFWKDHLYGIPVLRPEYVALHLFASMRYERAERIVETMWSSRLLSGNSLNRFLHTMARQGRNGIVALRQYLHVRGPGYKPTESGLETRTAQILDNAGIPIRNQVDTGGDDWIGRVDFRHEWLPLIIEVQSEFHHGSHMDRESDIRRIAALTSAGFTVVEVTENDVWASPSHVATMVREEIDRLS